MSNVWDFTVNVRAGYMWLQCPIFKCGFAVETDGNTLDKLHRKAREHFEKEHRNG